MTPNEFRKLLERDGGHCLHCGTTEGLVPQHRINRGHGGSKALEIPSNVVLVCSLYNGAMEADAEQASIARAHGWKLRPWQASQLTEIPVFDRTAAEWFILDNDYNRLRIGIS